jgi:hypothetical protein
MIYLGFLVCFHKGSTCAATQREFVDGGENVAFKLRLETPTWMSVGIHHPGRAALTPGGWHVAYMDPYWLSSIELQNVV